MAYTLEELKSKNVTTLKKIAKEVGVRGYSKFRAKDRDKLADMIFDHISKAEKVIEKVEKEVHKPRAQYSEQDLKKLKVPELKELAQSMGLRPSGRRKAELIKYILENMGPGPVVAAPIVKKKVGRRVSRPRKKKVVQRARKARRKVVEKVERKPSHRRRLEVEDDLLKKKVTELKAMLKAKGITIGLSGKKKAKLIEYLESPRCDPENKEFCPEDMICDVRNKLCISPDDVSKNLVEFNYQGKRIVGTKHVISILRKKLEEMGEEEEVQEEEPIVMEALPSILQEGVEIQEIEVQEEDEGDLAALLGEEAIPKPKEDVMVEEEDIVEIEPDKVVLPAVIAEPEAKIRELSKVQQYVVTQCLGLQA
jgi:hypothetical protein